MKTANTYSTEGIGVSSVDFEISESVERVVNLVKPVFDENPHILDVQVDGYPVWKTVKLFNSTIDDPNREEITKGDFDDFRSDVQRLIIKRSGALVLKAYGKWDGGAFLTFQIR